MPARRGRPPRHNRDDLVAAAGQVVVTRGYERLRYSDVADVSGVPVPSLQHYFPTLDQLRREALKWGVRRELDEIEDELARVSDPWEQLQTFVRSGIGRTDADRRPGWTMWVEYWAAVARDEEFAADSIEVDRIWLDRAVECIDRGKALGVFAVSVDTVAVARLLHALIDGFGVNLTTPRADEEAEEIIDLIESTLAGLLQRT